MGKIVPLRETKVAKGRSRAMAVRRAGILSLFEKLTLPESEAVVTQMFESMAMAGGVHVVAFLNAHAVNLSVDDTVFRSALLECDLLLRDGIGVKIGCRVLGLKPGPNLNGTDLIPQIVQRYKDQKIALFGAEGRWLEGAMARFREGGINSLVTVDGFQDEQRYVDAIRAERPALLVLGMGMPKQEILAQKLKAVAQEIGLNLMIVNGGAIIDFTAGKVSRAPFWLRRLGLEWLFRLAMEPRRLAKRYVIGNPVFLWRIAWVRARQSACMLTGRLHPLQ